MTTAHLCITLAILVYLGCMLYVGYRCSKNNNDSADFYLGGRKLGPLVTAMSAEASDMSSWLLMGLPGLAYLTGVADAGWTAIGLAIGTYLNWRIVAKRIRRYTHVAGNSITLPSFFSNRYRDEKKILQSIGAIFIVIFFIPYTASGFAACGKLFSTLFGVSVAAQNFLSKLLKTFDKTFREIFPVFISTKRREKPSAFFDNNFVNNAYFSEAASSSSSHLASSSSKAPISSRMTCLCLWSS